VPGGGQTLDQLGQLQQEPQRRRRPGPTLYRYFAREALRPTTYALLGLTVVVLTKDLLGFSDLVINRGLGLGVVSRIAFYESVPVAATMFPFAILVGCLVALGRLGADREILALEASGVSGSRLVWPAVALAGAATALSLLLSTLGAPWAERSLDRTLEHVSRAQPWAQFRAGAVNAFGGWQVEAREVSGRGDELRGVLLWVPEIGETVFAEQGRIETGPGGAVTLTLLNGSVLLSPRGGAKELRFESLSTELPASDEPLRRSDDERLAALPLDELALRAASTELSSKDHLPRASIEIHRRLALPIATLIFGFLAVPLFLTRRTFSRSGGGVLGLLATLSYFALVQFGEGLLQSGRIGVAPAVWLPNLALAAVAVVLLLRVRREGVLGHKFEKPRPAEIDEEHHDASVIRTHRYPLPRYIAGRFIQLALLLFGVLLTAYLLIDVMERLEWFARYRASGAEVLRFYGARLPLLASRVVPMALLVATALTVSLLAVEGELIGMRACGIPAPRALLPVLFIASVVAPAYFVLNNVVLPRTNALADELKRTEIKEEYYRTLEENRKAAVWYRSGTQVLEAALFDTDLGDAQELTIYEIGENGLPQSRSDARSARHIGHGVWRLFDPIRIEIANGHVREVPAHRYADLGETLPAHVDTMHFGVAELAREISEVEASGYDATLLRVDYHVKLAEALACVVLPAVMLFFAVGGPPFPGPAQTLLVSGILGVGYILLTGVAASLGYGGAIPPVVSGWGPTLSYAGLAGFFGLRLWRRL
jgi:LPS export ABC transporter permease LptF/LPS export ABC transporter permease LptG